MFPQNFPFLFEDRHPTYSVSHCSSGQAHSSSQTASRSVQPFLYGFQMLCLTMHCQWGRKPPNCPYPLGFRHVARGGPSHSHMQHPQKIGRDRSCGIGSILADIYKILQSLDVLAYSLNTSQPKWRRWNNKVVLSYLQAHIGTAWEAKCVQLSWWSKNKHHRLQFQ